MSAMRQVAQRIARPAARGVTGQQRFTQFQPVAPQLGRSFDRTLHPGLIQSSLAQRVALSNLVRQQKESGYRQGGKQ